MSYNCPICKKKYKDKLSLYEHLNLVHQSDLGGLSPAHFYFNMRNHKTGGTCIVCGKPTKFNESTEKYSRICSAACQKKYREQFKDRMKTKYGHEHLLDSPNQQKKMLAARKISGTYTWKSGYKHTYTGSYEKNFLEFLEHFMSWKNPEDVFAPAPDVFHYKYKNQDKFYIPDFYITSLDLYVEIKSTDNKHYRLRDLAQEEVKDSTMSGRNFIKVSENDFQSFIDYLMKAKEVE
jgi:hypothetical protein